MLVWIKKRIQQRKRKKIERGMLDFIEFYLEGYVSHYPGLTVERFGNDIDHWCFVVFRCGKGHQEALYQVHYYHRTFFFVDCKKDEQLTKWRKELLEYDVKNLSKKYLQDMAKEE